MKPKKQQLPKARAMWASNLYLAGDPVHMDTWSERCVRQENESPLAVIPTPTAKQAKAIASFFNLSEAEQVEAVAKVMCPHSWPKNKEYWLHDARAVLRRVKEGK